MGVFPLACRAHPDFVFLFLFVSILSPDCLLTDLEKNNVFSSNSWEKTHALSWR